MMSRLDRLDESVFDEYSFRVNDLPFLFRNNPCPPRDSLISSVSELGLCIIRGERANVHKMLDSGENFEPRYDGVSIIYLAVNYNLGKKGLRKLLVRSNMRAAINDLGENKQFSALHFAILQKDKKIIKLLLESGADVNLSTGTTALHQVAEACNDDMMPVAQWLLSRGVSSVNVKNTSGKTPLFEHLWWRRICFKGLNQEFISLMVANGAETSGIFDESVSTPQNHEILRTAILEGQRMRAERVNRMVTNLLGVSVLGDLVVEYDKEEQHPYVTGQLLRV